jgi:hypothetical protein
MKFGRQFGRFAVLIFALIQSIALVYIEDTFVRCYFDLLEPLPGFETFALDSETKCALACLRARQCAGFDICEDIDNSGHICRVRNETSVANCTVEYGQEDNPEHGDCEVYLRVSIYIIIYSTEQHLSCLLRRIQIQYIFRLYIY